MKKLSMLLLTIILTTACTRNSGPSVTSNPAPASVVGQVSVLNGQISVTGSNLSQVQGAKLVKVSGGAETQLVIESKSDGQLKLKASTLTKIAAGLYKLVIANANAAPTETSLVLEVGEDSITTIMLKDKVVTPEKLTPGAEGQILMTSSGGVSWQGIPAQKAWRLKIGDKVVATAQLGSNLGAGYLDEQSRQFYISGTSLQTAIQVFGGSTFYASSDCTGKAHYNYIPGFFGVSIFQDNGVVVTAANGGVLVANSSLNSGACLSGQGFPQTRSTTSITTPCTDCTFPADSILEKKFE